MDIKKLFFWRVRRNEPEEEGDVERLRLIVERDKLRSRVSELEVELKTLKTSVPLIDVNVGDPAPLDSATRKIYVAAVAGFHKDYLQPKIKQMLSMTHNLMEGMTNSRDDDLIMKGVAYTLREFDVWGNRMINEQVAYQNEGKIEKNED